jgi:hypothetical protein
MERSTRIAGIGALGFAVLTILALAVANPPGGSYSLKDITNYTAKSHRPAAFVSVYLALIGVIALLLMLSALRELAGDSPRQKRAAQIFWSAGLAAAAVLAVGWCIELLIPLSRALGGAKPIAPQVAYEFTQAGTVIIWGAGFFLLGCSLIAFAFASATIPAWWRWIAAIGGVTGILSTAFFPSFILALCVVVLGVGLLVHRGTATTTAAQAT